MRYAYKPTQMAKIKNNDHTTCELDCREAETLINTVGKVK